MKHRIKKRLLEVKERKENLLIERTMIEKRFSFLIESFGQFEDHRNLSENKKQILSAKILREIHILQKNNLISEQEFLTDILKNLFKGFGFGAIEGIIVEPFVNTLLSKLGLGGYFKNFLVSFFSTNPSRIVEAFKSCENLVKLVSEALVEATFMMIQQNKDMSGVGYDVLRNAIGKTIKETTFVKEIQKGISTIVCDSFDDIYEKAKEILSKVDTAKSTEK